MSTWSTTHPNTPKKTPLEVVDLTRELPMGAATRRFCLRRIYASKHTSSLTQFTPGDDYVIGVIPNNLHLRPHAELELYYHNYNGIQRYANYKFGAGVIEEVVLSEDKYYFRTKDNVCYTLEFLDSGN